ncbi:MAG: CotH kinase family protein [Lachnospiraceae bacterium]|nr:CotH kinase family protein [Lachnospiraceae bacterium]
MKKTCLKILFLMFALSVIGLGGCSQKAEKITATPTATPTQRVKGKVTATPTAEVKEVIEEPEDGKMPVLWITTETKEDVTSRDEYIKGTIKADFAKENYFLPETVIDIRGRGNGTWNFEKKSYKIKFEEKLNLLNVGEGKAKKWVLLANMCDQTLLRNYVALNFGASLPGIDYMPACRSVVVYLNGEYRGVYLLTEQIEEKKHKVRLDMSDLETSTDIGYLFEMSYYADDVVFNAANRNFKLKSDLSQNPSLASKQLTYIRDYVEECYTAVRSGKKDEIEKLIDIDSLVDTYLLEETIKNLDCGWDSFNMYKDAGGKLFFGPAWDFDLSLGNGDEGTEYPTDFYAALNLKGQSNLWFFNCMKQKWFREIVREHWNSQEAQRKNAVGMLLEEAEAGYDSYCRNFQKWDVLGTKQSRETAEILNLKTYKEHVDYLVKWMETRFAWLDEHINDERFLSDDFVAWATDMWNETTGDYAVAESGAAIPDATPEKPYGSSAVILNAPAERLEGNFKLLNCYINVSKAKANVPGYTGEDFTNLFDNDTGTKYCTFSYTNFDISFSLDEPRLVTHYALFTGNDTASYPVRNPNSWKLYASNDPKADRNNSWVLISDMFDGDALTTASRRGTGFETIADKPYMYYRIVFENGYDMMQLSELWLLEKTKQQ